MSETLIFLLVLLLVIILLLLFFVLQMQKKQSELKQMLSLQSNDIQLNLHKNLQENFFRFQHSIFDQLQQSQEHSKFVYEELEKDSKSLNSTLNSKLEEIKFIVDEKLHKTLEERLSHSFKIVADSLSKVQSGLGEMQVLANGVGDLKKVLSNVKTRGILGEIQLSNILEQILSTDQYGVNVSTIPNSNNFVEFAIKFPGNNDSLPYIWMPVDAKFPLDIYEHLINAYESNNSLEIAKRKKEIVSAIKLMATDISKKYIYPPYTTDFGIMFLPTESLYAEVLRIPGLIMDVQNNHKIMVVGPHNLSAFLTALQQGFKSIAIERRTNEVWKLLNIVKMEFSKFGDILERTQKKILEANKIIETAGAKSRSIERKLSQIDKIEVLQEGI